MYIGGARVTKRLITVRTALQLAATRSARLKEVEWLASGGMAEIADPQVRRDAWR